jgi:hypothetical protein
VVIAVHDADFRSSVIRREPAASAPPLLPPREGDDGVVDDGVDVWRSVWFMPPPWDGHFPVGN